MDFYASHFLSEKTVANIVYSASSTRTFETGRTAARIKNGDLDCERGLALFPSQTRRPLFPTLQLGTEREVLHLYPRRYVVVRSPLPLCTKRRRLSQHNINNMMLRCTYDTMKDEGKKPTV